MNHRIIQEGYVSEHLYSELENRSGKIFFPVTGYFVRLKDDPKAVFLYDNYMKGYHELSKVCFSRSISNPKEGHKKFPRPFITEQTAEDKADPNNKIGSKRISTGDIVEIVYIEGSVYNPLVRGSVETFGNFPQHKFLLFMPEDWEKEVQRYENDDYILEYFLDGKGELNLKVETKESGAGTGKITVNQVDKKTKLTQKVYLGEKKIQLLQAKEDGTIEQEFLLDNQAKKITSKDANKNIFEQSADGTKINGEYVLLQPALDWILNNATAFIMGNLGIPAPIIPSVAIAAQQGITEKSGFISNNNV